MLGTYVNAIVVVIGAFIGLLIKNGLSEKVKTTVIHSVGLATLFIGISTTLTNMMDGGEPILFIVSLVIGSMVGEKIDIDLRLNHLGQFLERKVGNGEHSIAKGFVTASLLFCVGTMTILGALESGLRGNHDILYAKSVLDGTMAIILTSSLGIGVFFSAGSILIYQGAITLLSSFIEPYLSAEILREISIIGGILIFSLGFNILEIKKIKTANMLPAILGPVIYFLLISPLVEMITG